MQQNAIRTIHFVSFPISLSLSQREYLFKTNDMYWRSGGDNSSAFQGQTLLCTGIFFALQSEVPGSNLGTDWALGISLETAPRLTGAQILSKFPQKIIASHPRDVQNSTFVFFLFPLDDYYQIMNPYQWRIQDFPEEGTPTPQGGANI